MYKLMFCTFIIIITYY